MGDNEGGDDVGDAQEDARGRQLREAVRGRIFWLAAEACWTLTDQEAISIQADR